MTKDLIFEAFNEQRYAPSLREFSNILFDSELENAIKNIPDKLAFKIGEVAELAGVESYVLRYWETEFDQLHPQKSAKNQRVYLKRDVEMVLMIKKLLYRDRFSIEGARVALKRLKRDSKQVRSVGGNLDQAEELHQSRQNNIHQDRQDSIRQGRQDSIRQSVEALVLHIASLKQLFT